MFNYSINICIIDYKQLISEKFHYVLYRKQVYYKSFVVCM